MEAVWKYSLKAEIRNTFSVPKGSKPLSCKIQNGTPQVWVHIPNTDPDAGGYENMTILAIPTGKETEKIEGVFIDTIHFEKENLVFHIFWENAK